MKIYLYYIITKGVLIEKMRNSKFIYSTCQFMNFNNKLLSNKVTLNSGKKYLL